MADSIEDQINRLASEATLRQVQKAKQLLELVQEQIPEWEERLDAAYLEEQLTLALAQEFSTGIQFSIANSPDAQDAALFRFWIDMAARAPSKVGVALAHCLYAEDYRKALISLSASQPSERKH